MTLSLAGRPGRIVWVILLLIGFVAVAGIAGYLLAQRFKPHWFDEETIDPAKLQELRSADLKQSPAAAAATGWPQWFGPNRDGRAPAGPLRTDWEQDPPTPLWTAPCGGGYSSFAVVDGRAYTMDRQGDRERVLCLDAEAGKLLWEHGWEADYSGVGYGSGPRATPTVHEGRLYALGATGKLVCLRLDPSADRLAWERDLTAEFGAPTPQWGFASSPLIVDDLVVVQAGGRGASVVAFDKTTGEPRWKGGSDENGYSSPVLTTADGVRQIVAVTGESILGLRPETGEVLWRHDWRTRHNGNVATPVVFDDYVFASSSYAKGCVLLKLSADGGGVKAETVFYYPAKFMKNHHSTCVYKDGYLYGYDDDVLRCLNLREDGKVVEDWNARAVSGGGNKGSVILAGDHLIGLTQSGTLYLADANPDEFRLRGKVERVLSGSDCWALPVLVDGRIYLRDAQKIVCLDARPR